MLQPYSPHPLLIPSAFTVPIHTLTHMTTSATALGPRLHTADTNGNAAAPPSPFSPAHAAPAPAPAPAGPSTMAASSLPLPPTSSGLTPLAAGTSGHTAAAAPPPTPAGGGAGGGGGGGGGGGFTGGLGLGHGVIPPYPVRHGDDEQLQGFMSYLAAEARPAEKLPTAGVVWGQTERERV